MLLLRSPLLLPRSATLGSLQSRTLVIPPRYFGKSRRRAAALRLLPPRVLPPNGQVTYDIAKTMPLAMNEMDNQVLVTLGALGDHEAHSEILKRHIMTIDRCSYSDAEAKFREIEEASKVGAYMLSLPYKIGIGVAVMGAFGSIPMVFDLTTAQWFNEHFVTTDVPEPKDLETCLEVGSWTWNWMEPPLGQISFFLLCLQYSRAQLENLGIKPYTRKIKQMRGERLSSQFPQYESRLLVQFSESASFN